MEGGREGQAWPEPRLLQDPNDRVIRPGELNLIWAWNNRTPAWPVNYSNARWYRSHWDGEEGDADPEAECKAEFKPVVQLEEVETSTGEEDETQLLNM